MVKNQKEPSWFKLTESNASAGKNNSSLQRAMQVQAKTTRQHSRQPAGELSHLPKKSSSKKQGRKATTQAETQQKNRAEKHSRHQSWFLQFMQSNLSQTGWKQQGNRATDSSKEQFNQQNKAALSETEQTTGKKKKKQGNWVESTQLLKPSWTAHINRAASKQDTAETEATRWQKQRDCTTRLNAAKKQAGFMAERNQLARTKHSS